MIEETRLSVASLDQQDRFIRAKIHLEDALKYKNPRIDRFDPNQSCLYTYAFIIQSSFIW